MEYSIHLPCEFDLGDWFNIGIDFHPQWVTANHRVTRDEVVLLRLGAFAIELDNRYIKDYRIEQEERGQIVIKIII
jgi:hypothetical protein